MRAQISIVPSASASRSRLNIPPEARATLIDLACDFAITGSCVYELGQAVAELLPTLRANHPRGVQFVRADLNRGGVVSNASVAIMAGTSRRVHPLQRPQLLADVYRGLRAGGCALVMEMVRSRDSLLNNLFALHGSEAEAIQAAGTLDEECALLEQSEFRSIEIFYKRYGLCGLIAIK